MGQTWFYEDNKKAEIDKIGSIEYTIKKGIVTVKSGEKKAEFRFKADENHVCMGLYTVQYLVGTVLLIFVVFYDVIFVLFVFTPRLVPNVAFVSGLYSHECPFGFL